MSVQAPPDIEPGQRVELVCLHAYEPIRARVPPHGPVVLVRPGISRLRPVPGEVFELEVTKSWIFGRSRHLSGTITGVTFDVSRLELEPLAVETLGDQVPNLDDLPDEIVAELRGKRLDVCEMEQVLPARDPVSKAADLIEEGMVGEAAHLLQTVLIDDLRCLDAYAHLGLIDFEFGGPYSLDHATRHFRIGVEIGDLSVGDDFQGLLPWGLLDNRPFLRCLHGLGLCLWRGGDFERAKHVFRRMLLLNPDDNRGIRLLWPEIVAGEAWAELGG